jgi:hypothetical protein
LEQRFGGLQQGFAGKLKIKALIDLASQGGTWLGLEFLK